MKKLRWFLLPFTLLYVFITELRNFFFSIGVLPSKEFHFPIIVIGNLSTGGTGKSPMANAVLKLIGSKNPALLSRGYGRKTKGFRKVNLTDTADTVGDEPLMIKQLNPEKQVFVGEDRVKAIEQILTDKAIGSIVLDDAFQHRKLKAGYTILLTTFNDPFYTDQVLPVGNLREMRKNAARANAIVVSKCPDKLTVEEQNKIAQRIKSYSDVPVFFTRIAYGEPVALFEPQPFTAANVLLVTGIANNSGLVAYCKEKFNRVEVMEFNDHYEYKANDFKRIAEKFDSFAQAPKVVLTTHKDAIKWMTAEYLPFKQLPVYYLPIEVEFLREENVFNELIKNYVERFETNR